MKLYHVVAMAKNRVIGKDNKLPWHFSSDLKHFKQLTTGSTVIMGRKTFESIGKPLPNRENIVLSTTPRKNSPGLQFAASLEEALKNVRTFQAYIIGGENLYRQTMDKVDGIYLTNIEGDYEGDAFYPEMPSYFKEKSKTLLQENPKIEMIFYANTKKGRS